MTVLVIMTGFQFVMASSHLQAFPSVPAIIYICLAIVNIAVPYAGYVALSTLFSQFRVVKGLPKALACLQTYEVILYKVSAIALYFFVGNDIATPVLGSVGKLFRKVSTTHKFAMPTVTV
ncbi:hypothetical protein N7494_010200 [Penicillium frequentans]|uniref:Uncharacterized protein n=1 Tax=Penicillium frequentans TaxID=3151616 RepID=A0AAD6CRD3_9EURO|nr:hypothetical protein N7494_010200 [Penicillium glabrum]